MFSAHTFPLNIHRLIHLASYLFAYKTANHLDSVNLIPNKAHAWDDISCSKSIVFSLKLLFSVITGERSFPRWLEKSNIVPVHKKENKNLIKNYWPISLLPIFSKFYVRLIFNSIFNCLVIKNNLFTKSQSGFLPCHPFISQLLSVTHEIYRSFDCNTPFDIKRTFLHISKAFDKVWCEGLIFKLHTDGINEKLLNAGLLTFTTTTSSRKRTKIFLGK